MGNIYIFGDSYSYGDGLIFGNKLQPKPKNYEFFPNLLSKKFNKKLINLSKSGGCNWEILETILQSIPKITNDDIVVASTSFPARTFMINHYSERQIIGSRNDIYTNDTLFWKDWKTKSLSEQEIILKNFEENSCGKSLKEIHDSTRKYVRDVLEPQSSLWESQWTSLFLNTLNSFCIPKNIPYILWPVSNSKEYETIIQATSGKIKDYHWSWKGSHEHGEYLYNNILNKYPNLKEII